ncbi:type I-E CRISPR-associated protein Cse2/CasB [Corynebacterium diphtheriae]|uniref:type I-E CRISPR-associated protein Cse2/CasB n=1 Tax=Corynebacterium diphtheriae TaxID=1717 RepID=UPI000245B83E|nr:type I-E CRISPR-associated protein Cse2/CasB [Corynebacterium diphtheriae]AEX45348.1 CRISPR-associated protein [Corynebacterium diphtheriae INCA 402]OJI00753.1 type I-E CRISPR-associated protein Cse2/CasB [Corynebacterium diphtheriae]OSQ09066.1 type I-E CRISPR-associated protein Cse2/CasB [Corynebacterium diphtheriae]OWM43839.1 type I-E CRISPR-associated protein Cse2/CasB [Corynebacterium diphtheriae]OWM49288.1 type I-E CRISPR-associated protein Cse2/CasB [Corynebacterium diphtheriae]
MAENKDALRAAVGATCHRLQEAYLGDRNSARHHSARATLAELRRGATVDIRKNPLGLEKVLFAMAGDFSDRLVGHGDNPSPSEEAAFVALTLFGVHMQSATSPVHIPQVSFASACGRLHSLGTSDSIKPRVDAMLLASQEQARLVHIRSLVTLLRANNIGFDYGLLARDLRALNDPKKRAGIQLRWGRDFAIGHFHNSNSTTNSTQTA